MRCPFGRDVEVTHGGWDADRDVKALMTESIGGRERKGPHVHRARLLRTCKFISDTTQEIPVVGRELHFVYNFRGVVPCPQNAKCSNDAARDNDSVPPIREYGPLQRDWFRFVVRV